MDGDTGLEEKLSRRLAIRVRKVQGAAGLYGIYRSSIGLESTHNRSSVEIIKVSQALDHRAHFREGNQ